MAVRPRGEGGGAERCLEPPAHSVTRSSPPASRLCGLHCRPPGLLPLELVSADTSNPGIKGSELPLDTCYSSLSDGDAEMHAGSTGPPALGAQLGWDSLHLILLWEDS